MWLARTMDRDLTPWARKHTLYGYYLRKEKHKPQMGGHLPRSRGVRTVRSGGSGLNCAPAGLYVHLDAIPYPPTPGAQGQ